MFCLNSYTNPLCSSPPRGGGGTQQVLQGCILSPTLFNFYISDLPQFLNTACLLYADDLVIFSRSAKSFQIILNKLESFCENADVSGKLDKTKIMIFNNCGKSLDYYSFRYGADQLENVKSYKYLGVIMSPYIETLISLSKSLKKVAFKAL